MNEGKLCESTVNMAYMKSYELSRPIVAIARLCTRLGKSKSGIAIKFSFVLIRTVSCAYGR